MRNLFLIGCMLSFIGCGGFAPKKIDHNNLSDDDFTMPLYNGEKINKAIDAASGEEVKDNKLGADAEKVNNFNDTGAQNILMYSGMKKVQDPKDRLNCFKHDEDDFNDRDHVNMGNNVDLNLDMDLNNSNYFNDKDLSADSEINDVQVDRSNNMRNKSSNSMKHESNHNSNNVASNKSNQRSESNKAIDVNLFNVNDVVLDRHQLSNQNKKFKKNNRRSNVKNKRVFRNKNSNKKYCIVYKKKR